MFKKITKGLAMLTSLLILASCAEGEIETVEIPSIC